jgi:hypothetical protein
MPAREALGMAVFTKFDLWRQHGICDSSSSIAPTTHGALEAIHIFRPESAPRQTSRIASMLAARQCGSRIVTKGAAYLLVP